MRKLISVLALLLACGMSFAVTGSLYIRYNSGNALTETEWGTLDDLRVGRRGSGFDINLDKSIGVSYKLRSDMQILGTIGTGYTNLGVDTFAFVSGSTNLIKMTSIGYFQANNLKAGAATMSVGAAYWHYDNSLANFATNGSTTNLNNTSAYNADYIAANYTLNIPFSDKVSFDIFSWDQLQVDYGWDVASSNNGTNLVKGANATTLRAIVPLHLNMDMGFLNLEIFPKATYQGNTENYLTSIASNNLTSSDLHAGVMIRANFKIDNVWGFYAHIGFDDDITGSSSFTTGNSYTNTTVGSVMTAPILLGVSFAPVNWVTLNVGLGYGLTLASSGQSITGGNTTNNTTSSTGLFSIYSFFDEHSYQKPFLHFSGAGKFATDWELGLNTVTVLNGTPMGPVTTYSGTTTSSTGTSGSSTVNNQFLHFVNGFCWDNNCYIKYDNKVVAITGVFGNSTVGSSDHGLLGLFGFIDMSINF